jgi:hypothetical protein
MTAADRIKATIKMTDDELERCARTIANRINAIKPSEDRDRIIDDVLEETHIMFDGDMDIRNAYDPPMSWADLYKLISEWFVEMGYLRQPKERRKATRLPPWQKEKNL